MQLIRFLTVSQKTKKAKLKKKKDMKAKKTPKAKEPKPFRFLDLPPELRDMIYELALTDRNGVSIVACERGYRHSVRRGEVYVPEAYRRGYFRQKRLLPDQEELPPIETKFIPAMLALNKQINAEAINYLYGHDFVFQNSAALHCLLATVGPRNQQRLINVDVMDWGREGAAKAMNYSSMTLLAGATNLKSLRFLCDVGYWSIRPNRVARRLFRDAVLFFEAYGRANGRKDAAVDILHFGDVSFHTWAPQHQSPADAHESFKFELRRLLGVNAVTPKANK